MDHICVKTNRYRQLEQIGKLAAIHVVESEEYVKLAMFVEQYIHSNSTESLELIKSQMLNCINNFSDFNQTKNNLIMELLNINYLSTNREQDDSESLPPTTIPPTKSLPITPNKIVNLFNKKDS